MAIGTGFGSTLGFGTTSTWSPAYVSIAGPAQSREALNTSHLGTAGGYHTYIPGDLVEGGEVTAEFFFENSVPPMAIAPETITITNPNSATTAFTGFVTGFETAERATDTLMRATLTIKVAGAVTFTPDS